MKTLIIIGSYPNTQISIDVLKKCIESLNKNFDIALSTHYPVNVDIQHMCNYYFYDSENPVIQENNNPIKWFRNELFYLQVKHLKNHAYAAYSSILNALNVLHKQYSDFFYINGDTLFSETDILKLINLKDQIGNKKAIFFKEFEGMVDAKIFYSDIKFFIKEFSNINSKDDFVKYTKSFVTPYVSNVLESYFAERIDKYFSNDIFIINENLGKYFDTSQIDVLDSINGNPEKKRDYQVHLVKENNSNKIFFAYINFNLNFEPKKINFKLNNEEFVLDNGCYSFFKEVMHDGKIIHLDVENSSKIYYVNEIIKNTESYIQFN